MFFIHNPLGIVLGTNFIIIYYINIVFTLKYSKKYTFYSILGILELKPINNIVLEVNKKIPKISKYRILIG